MHGRPTATTVPVKSAPQAAANRKKESMARERPAMAVKGQAATANQPVSATLSHQTVKQQKSTAVIKKKMVNPSTINQTSHQNASQKGRKK